jgi:hypothetical protein
MPDLLSRRRRGLDLSPHTRRWARRPALPTIVGGRDERAMVGERERGRRGAAVF